MRGLEGKWHVNIACGGRDTLEPVTQEPVTQEFSRFLLRTPVERATQADR